MCRQVVGTFKHSTSMSAKLTAVIKAANQRPEPEQPESEYLYLDEETEQQFMKSTEEDSGNRNKNVKTKLIQDMVVRWNSTLAMLTRLVLFSDHIR